MAGRFVIQKLASGISRSRASLGAHGPSARAAAPAAGTVPAARYFSRTSMPSVIINPVKPACVDSFGGAKEPLSSMASTRQQISRKEKMAAWESKMDAITAARQAQYAASRAELKAEIAGFNKFVIKVTVLSCFAGSCVFWALLEEEKRRRSLCKGQSSSLVCRSWCDGQHGFQDASTFQRFSS